MLFLRILHSKRWKVIDSFLTPLHIIFGGFELKCFKIDQDQFWFCIVSLSLAQSVLPQKMRSCIWSWFCTRSQRLEVLVLLQEQDQEHKTIVNDAHHYFLHRVPFML